MAVTYGYKPLPDDAHILSKDDKLKLKFIIEARRMCHNDITDYSDNLESFIEF